MKIRKAIFPVAGFGTRLLPATKAVPKELIPVWDKPILHHVVEECQKSKIKEILFITSQGKEIILDYFDRNASLEEHLRKKEKDRELEAVMETANLANFYSIRQKEIKGLGHAILQGKEWVGNEPFAVVLTDDLVISKVPCINQLIKIYEKYKLPVVALEEVPQEDTFKYGIIDGKEIEKNVFKIKDMIEKPAPEVAPSNLAIIGRYILTPEIFKFLEDTKEGKGGEIQLTDALQKYTKKGIIGYKFEGIRCDMGTPEGFLWTNLVYGLNITSLRPLVLQILSRLSPYL
ncbi:MAG: UTP--glucose-1-phosphate uridylyltransferase GalU [Thermoanaerobaculia bacterium]